MKYKNKNKETVVLKALVNLIKHIDLINSII